MKKTVHSSKAYFAFTKQELYNVFTHTIYLYIEHYMVAQRLKKTVTIQITQQNLLPINGPQGHLHFTMTQRPDS